MSNTRQTGYRQEPSSEAIAMAALVHELKSPLQVLANLLHLIQVKQEHCDPSVREYLALAEKELSRLKGITARMLGSFRHAFENDETEVSIARVLEDSLGSLREKIQYKRVNVEKRLEAKGTIRAVPEEIRHVFDNVLRNALEAVPLGGKIILHLVQSRDWRTGRTGCRVVICDNGPGIPPGNRAKIFEPFFTTKAGTGTGIGLWMTHRIVSNHSGSIRVRSSVEKNKAGTAFSVFLPSRPSAEVWRRWAA